jgi:F-type H+-transporting ATPase subunit delta
MAEAELATIARPYARAVFSVALNSPEGLSAWSNRLNLLAGAASDEKLADQLDDPKLSSAEASSLLASLFAEELNDTARNFLSVLASNGRLMLLPTIAGQFESLKAQHEKTMRVTLASAFEVTEAEQSLLESALRSRLQRDIEIETTIDANLLGGVLIRTEDTVIDDSVRGKLDKLAGILR